MGLAGIHRLFRLGGAWLFTTAGGAEFLVTGEGRELQCYPGPGGWSAETALVLARRVLPRCLDLRGRQVLHGAALAHPAGGVALLVGAVRLCGVARVARWLRKHSGRRGPLGVDVASARLRGAVSLARTLQLASAVAWIWRAGSGCLPRSLLGFWLLLAAGREPVLVVGVRRTAAAPLRAHAWLELEGRPVEEPPETLSAFTVLARY